MPRAHTSTSYQLKSNYGKYLTSLEEEYRKLKLQIGNTDTQEENKKDSFSHQLETKPDTNLRDLKAPSHPDITKASKNLDEGKP